MIAFKTNDNSIYIGQNVLKRENANKVILNITIPDMCALIKCSNEWFSSLGIEDTDFVFSPASNNLKLLTMFDTLDRKYNPDYVIEHNYESNSQKSENNLTNSKSNDAQSSKSVEKVSTTVPVGTSKLVYSPSRGTVKIAKRTSKPKDKCPSEYSVYISDDTREDFFRDVRKSVGFSKFSKWEISDMYDPKLFTKWREIMRNSDGLKRGWSVYE